MTSGPDATRTGGLRRFAGPAAIVATLGLIVLCYATADRAAATWSHAMFSAGGPAAPLLGVFIGLTHLIDPLPPLAALGFLGLGARLVASPRPAPLLRAPFAAAVATLIAIAVKEQLKFAFGRLWPETWVGHNPSWIADGAYGFAPFHGGPGWASFPSGHMTVITAPMVVVMLGWPGLRRWPLVPILLVALGLYGADYHFLSDILAGVLLGAVCAALVWATLPGFDRGRPRS